jgi:hypothetical protein
MQGSMSFVSPRWFVRLWIAGFLLSGFSAQGVGQRDFALSTAWGINAGWQREIFFFNLFAATVLAIIDRKAPNLDRPLVLPLTLLPLCLGLNHLSGALSGAPVVVGNWMGAVSNGLAVAFGALVLLTSRKEIA